MANFHLSLFRRKTAVFRRCSAGGRARGRGDFGVLADHAPMVTTLRPGILTVHAAGEHKKSLCWEDSPRSRP
jgi:F-type H+-transporting ATPase subunit epsilon